MSKRFKMSSLRRRGVCYNLFHTVDKEKEKMNSVDERLNKKDVKAVQDHLEKMGVSNYDMRPGNNCVWVSYGLVNCYYIMDQEHNIRDVQVD